MLMPNHSGYDIRCLIIDCIILEKIAAECPKITVSNQYI